MFGLNLVKRLQAQVLDLEAQLEEARKDTEAPAALREMKFCQSLTSHWQCSTRKICTLNGRCARPDDAYKSIEWAEPRDAEEMGRTAYFAGLDITWDNPFNGSQFKQHAQAYFRLGYLEACFDQKRNKMKPSDFEKEHAIREQSRRVLGLEKHSGAISGRTYKSIAQDIADSEDDRKRSMAKQKKKVLKA